MLSWISNIQIRKKLCIVCTDKKINVDQTHHVYTTILLHAQIHLEAKVEIDINFASGICFLKYHFLKKNRISFD